VTFPSSLATLPLQQISFPAKKWRRWRWEWKIRAFWMGTINSNRAWHVIHKLPLYNYFHWHVSVL